jgi:ribosome-associated protein
MPEDTSKFIPENEIQLSFARSSGAGGQNVNKTSTKVIVHWSVGRSTTFTEEEKQRIRTKLANRLNAEDEIVVMSEEERSQPQNRELAIERLRLLVTGALYVPRKRKPTRPTYSSKLKKVESKKIRSEVKKTRRSLTDFI